MRKAMNETPLDWKKLTRRDFEIMAPAGSRESLMAAIDAGADAVYFGIGALNMRSHSAAAFTIDDLKEIARLCNERGVKSYLTVNTIIYDDDMATMREIVDAAKEAGISAVIASDVAVMQYCAQKGVSVHLSTQLNISNTEALRFYANFADVVVLARELHMGQVAKIHRAILDEGIKGPSGEPVRIEMFCHGALCMAVSGKCYMSLHTRGKSANRGGCLQNCRREYRAYDIDRGTELEIDNGYVMSPKDLKTIGFMDLMIKAGVRVFKIEGRARGPEYVKTVVDCYSEAIEAVLEGHWSEEVSTSWDDRLATVFNRGFWDGWYQGRTAAEWTDRYGSQATEKKVYIGKCLKYYAKPEIGYFLIHGEGFAPGDRLLITGPTTGAVYVTPDEVRREETILERAEKGMDVTFRIPEKVRENDKLYLIKSVKREDEL